MEFDKSLCKIAVSLFVIKLYLSFTKLYHSKFEISFRKKHIVNNLQQFLTSRYKVFSKPVGYNTQGFLVN